MGQITDIKAGNRGCAFNDRFTLQYIQAANSAAAIDLGCVNGSSSPDGKIRNKKTIISNVNNTSSGSMGPLGNICNGSYSYCCYGNNSYKHNSSWSEQVKFVVTPEGEFIVGSVWNGTYSKVWNDPVTCCGGDCETDCESGGYFHTENGFWRRTLNPDGTFTEEQEGYYNGLVTSIASEDCDSGSNNINDSGNSGTCCCPEDGSCTLGLKQSECICENGTLHPCGSYSESNVNNGTAMVDDGAAATLLGALRGSTSVKLSNLFGQDAWEYYDELEDPSYIYVMQEVGPSYLTSQRVKFRFIKDDRQDNSDLDIYIIETEEKYYLEFYATEEDEDGEPVQVGDAIRILIGSANSSFPGNELYGEEFDFTNQDYQQESLINQPVLGCINIRSITRI